MLTPRSASLHVGLNSVTVSQRRKGGEALEHFISRLLPTAYCLLPTADCLLSPVSCLLFAPRPSQSSCLCQTVSDKLTTKSNRRSCRKHNAGEPKFCRVRNGGVSESQKKTSSLPARQLTSQATTKKDTTHRRREVVNRTSQPLRLSILCLEKYESDGHIRDICHPHFCCVSPRPDPAWRSLPIMQ